ATVEACHLRPCDSNRKRDRWCRYSAGFRLTGCLRLLREDVRPEETQRRQTCCGSYERDWLPFPRVALFRIAPESSIYETLEKVRPPDRRRQRTKIRFSARLLVSQRFFQVGAPGGKVFRAHREV